MFEQLEGTFYRSRSAIVALGSYAPGPAIPNDYFDKYYHRDVSTYLRVQRNILKRHFMDPKEATSDLIVPAAQEALANAKLKPEDIDLIIVATDTPDYISPATANVVQYKLGAHKAGCFDINAACAGFVIAIDMADKYIASDHLYKNILVAGAYGMSRYFDWSEYKVTSTFADGAGVAIVQRMETDNPYEGILASELFARGEYHDYLGIYAGGTRTPASHESIDNKQHLIKFVKPIPPETNSTEWPRLIRCLLERLEMKAEEVNRFFFTQIDIRSINQTLDQLGLPHTRAHNVMDQYGYTGSACIAMALADACRKHLLKKGDNVFLMGSGGGMSMAAVAMRWEFDT